MATPLKMGSTITPSYLLTQTGTYLLGILLGELLHRLGLLYEESFHLNTRYRKKRPGQSAGWKGALGAVFSNTHHQLLVTFLLLLGAIFCLVVGGGWDMMGQVGVNIFPVLAVWAIFRMIGAFDNSVEDLDILEENNALLGPGLAANYWFSFLRPLVTGDIKNKFQEQLRAVQTGDDMVRIVADRVYPPPARGGNYRTFDRLIILQPSDCHLEIKDEGKLEVENIFKHTENCQTEESCNHDVYFKVEPAQRRPPIKQTVHWIYEDPKDEANHPVPDASKIFVMFDFPQILQSAMGPHRGWEESEKPGARKRNLKEFRETLRSLLNCTDYSQMKKSITFHSFKVEKEEMEDPKDGSQTKKRSLSTDIREKVLADERTDRLQEIYSSSSGSDSEV